MVRVLRSMSVRQLGGLAFLVSGGLLGGALVFQYGFGLHPCEMCIWQRIPHGVVLVVAVVLMWTGGVPEDPHMSKVRRLLSFLLVVLFAISGALGLFHAGVEYGWWDGITQCTAISANITSIDDMEAALSTVPVTRCDVVPWSLFGISMAGYNAVISFAACAAVACQVMKGKV